MFTKQLFVFLLAFVAYSSPQKSPNEVHGSVTTVSGAASRGGKGALTGRAVPGVHVLRRMITGYRPGSPEATVTVVYRTDSPVTVRWFRKAERKLPNSEVPDMLTVEGNRRFSVSTLRSGSVVANTLTIRNIPRNYKTSYTTVWDFTDFPMQYMLDTKIDKPYERFRDDSVDGMRWIRIPQPSLEFTYKGRFSVRCGIVMDSERDTFLETVNLYKNYFETKPPLVSESLGTANTERGNYVDRSPRYVYRGNRRLRGAGGKYRYEASVTVTNATRDDQGMYICGAERQQDRTYVSSWVSQGIKKTKPIVELIACGDAKTRAKPSGRNSRRKQRPSAVRVTMSSNDETCFRCRASGYPPPTVNVYRAGSMVQSDSTVLIDRHVNVPDGGMPETTYTYLRPSYRRHNGNYRCTARNAMGETSVDFRVDVQ